MQHKKPKGRVARHRNVPTPVQSVGPPRHRMEKVKTGSIRVAMLSSILFVVGVLVASVANASINKKDQPMINPPAAVVLASYTNEGRKKIISGVRMIKEIPDDNEPIAVPKIKNYRTLHPHIPAVSAKAWHAILKKRKQARIARRAAREARRIMDERDTLILVASKEIGNPYVFGATGPYYFDCSGLVQYVYRTAIGKYLPRLGYDQYAAGTPVTQAQADPGDIVAFYDSSGYIYHVALYAGNGRIIEAANPSAGVRTGPIWSSNVEFSQILPNV